MKLLLDENLSRRLLPELQALFPGSTHVVPMGLQSASDHEVWERAAAEGWTIVTKDADFVELAVLRGAPPMVIRLALGNVPNDVVVPAWSLMPPRSVASRRAMRRCWNSISLAAEAGASTLPDGAPMRCLGCLGCRIAMAWIREVERNVNAEVLVDGLAGVP